jgi:NCAIR mutase (PurE)-related protein
MTDPILHIDSFATIDLLRQQRTGMPEVVYAINKTTTQTLAIVAGLLARNGRALVSRATPETVAALCATYDAHMLTRGTADRIITIATPTSNTPTPGGDVGIIAAGTSDLAVADDVGVAGLHRLFEPLRHLLSVPVDVIIVAAGMDGALPSVVTGLVDVPVIGLPAAVGYGFGGEGHAALGTMLQSCAPGITVVNIDNGVGAGAAAARIARRAFLARQKGASA